MSNCYAANLLEQISERFSVDSLNMSMTDWVTSNTTMKKRPFSLKGYEFQRQILDDMHPNLSCIKISQVGLTEIQIRKSLAFLVRNQGTSAIFSLPNQDMYERISNTRVKPIVDQDKVFNTAYDRANKAVRNTGLRQFGQSFLYLVPAIESAATSIDADMVLNDEVDLSDQSMISLFNSRLQGSDYRISQRFSTPSFPAYGVDLDWKSSDQHHYMVKCDCCGHWTYPEFNKKFIHLPGVPDDVELWDITSEMQDDLVFSEAYVRCDRCEQPLDLSNPELRQWVSKFPNRSNSRGYCINPFVTDRLDIPYIFTSLWRFMKSENKRGFFNTVLGQPYTDGSIQIPEEAIRACMTNTVQPPDFSGMSGLSVGIDVGQICHITIGDQFDNPVGFFQIHVDQLIDWVKKFCTDNQVACGSIDRHPYEPTADEVYRISEGKIIPTEYRGTKDENIVLDAFGEITHAQVNRTTVLDRVATNIKKGLISISGYAHYKEVIIAHLRNMVRDETPEKPAEWKKLSTDDHYFHSMAFMMCARDLAGLVKLKQKEDPRTMVLGLTVNISDGAGNMPGVSRKRVDPVPFRR